MKKDFLMLKEMIKNSLQSVKDEIKFQENFEYSSNYNAGRLFELRKSESELNKLLEWFYKNEYSFLYLLEKIDNKKVKYNEEFY